MSLCSVIAVQAEIVQERMLHNFAMTVLRRRMETEAAEAERGLVQSLRLLNIEITELIRRRSLFSSFTADRDDLLPPYIMMSLWVKLPSIFVLLVYTEKLPVFIWILGAGFRASVDGHHARWAYPRLSSKSQGGLTVHQCFKRW